MAFSKTEICNIALSHIGIGNDISNIETEQSAEAKVCRRFYQTALETTLRDYEWPFATVYVELGLVIENPTDEWAYSYRYPADCLKVRKILSGVRNDTRQSRIPYRFSRDSSGRLVFTDAASPCIEYTLRTEDPTQFPPDFVMAMAYKLAHYIAPRISIGDPFGKKTEMLELYVQEISMAQAAAANEEQPEEEPTSEFERSRNS